MRKVCVLLIALLVAALPAALPVQAQDKATEVLAKMRQAIGGGKLDSLKTFSLTGKNARNMPNGQIVSEIEMYLELPDKYLRVENLTAPIARTLQTGHNGDKPILPQGMNAGGAGAPMVIMNGAPAAAGGGGGMRVMTEMVVAGGGTRGGGSGEAANVTPEMRNAQMIRAQRIDLSRMMLGWFGMAHPGLNATYTYGGEAESPDGKAHIINVKADGGFEAKLFIDQATNMPLMVSWQALEPIRLTNIGPGRGGAPAGGTPPPPPPPPAAGAAQPPVVSNTPPAGQTPMTQDEMQKRIDEAMKNRKMIEYRVYFGDWKEVNGIQFPHMLQRATGSETTEELTISKVQLNPKIDAKKFQQ
jgi:hypothetical protein